MVFLLIADLDSMLLLLVSNDCASNIRFGIASIREIWTNYISPWIGSDKTCFGTISGYIDIIAEWVIVRYAIFSNLCATKEVCSVGKQKPVLLPSLLGSVILPITKWTGIKYALPNPNLGRWQNIFESMILCVPFSQPSTLCSYENSKEKNHYSKTCAPGHFVGDFVIYPLC